MLETRSYEEQTHIDEYAANVSQSVLLAQELAQSHKTVYRQSRDVRLLNRIKQQETDLQAAYHHFGKASREEIAVSYAAEWILDNFYIIQQALRQSEEDIPPHFYAELPKLSESSLRDYPRVFALAWGIVGHSKSQLDLHQIEQFVHAYQDITPLMMGELWAVPAMLRIGVLESLTQAVNVLTGITSPNQSQEQITPLASNELANEAIVANSILSLRSLATYDWKTFFENVSYVDQILRADPIYAQMDFDTRNMYRIAVEQLAKAAGKTEELVARTTVQLSQHRQVNLLLSDRTAHIGYYLVDAGLRQLENALAYKPPFSLRRWLREYPTFAYLGSILFITIALLIGLVSYTWQTSGTFAHLLGVVLFATVPMSAIAISLTNWAMCQILPPRILPRLDLEDSIPEAYQSLIVIPALLTSNEEIDSLLEQLELHYIRNTDPALRFALLTDFADAPQQHMSEDDSLVARVVAGIRALNTKYPRETPGPFYVFHRERQWNPQENCWMGWERKRGKLTELNRLLRGKPTSYVM